MNIDLCKPHNLEGLIPVNCGLMTFLLERIWVQIIALSLKWLNSMWLIYFFKPLPNQKKKKIVIIKEKEDKRKGEEFFFSLKVEERTMRTDIFWQFKMGKKIK